MKYKFDNKIFEKVKILVFHELDKLIKSDIDTINIHNFHLKQEIIKNKLLKINP